MSLHQCHLTDTQQHCCTTSELSNLYKQSRFTLLPHETGTAQKRKPEQPGTKAGMSWEERKGGLMLE